MSRTSPARCRGCHSTALETVLDLGLAPAADHFPPADSVATADESAHPLRMDLCLECGLAQLAEDDTQAEEPRGVEPLALRLQAAEAVRRVAESGWMRGATVREFPSPHGGSWLPLLEEYGFRPAEAADVVLDSFGIMHDADQRAALEQRRDATAPGGVLLLQYHSLLAVVAQGHWNMLRHGHFGYYSLTALRRLLADVGMRLAAAWEFDLYGGTVLLAAVHQDDARAIAVDPVATAILKREREFGITRPGVVGRLARAAQIQARALRDRLEDAHARGRSVYAYGAPSRAVALLALAGVTRRLLPAVADAAPSKHGRRMPGTDIPIVSPDELVASDPDDVILTLPDLFDEVSAQYPQLAGRWRLDWTELAPTLARTV
ncbi:class I SAM-dependent methyltransferase [Mycobacterium sp. SMC-4]|uniref:class I SAM-dependent methyltransferase n=1 Tax=Mycobacterium sp. SMC-4 TaxID=2857059 RepID=UPI003CFC9337